VNQTEKRRQKLLQHTRNLYNDKRGVPAVHPRYRASYNQIYREQTNEYTGSSAGFRSILCIVVFVAYIVLKNNSSIYPGFNDLQVLEIIMHNLV